VLAAPLALGLAQDLVQSEQKSVQSKAVILTMESGLFSVVQHLRVVNLLNGFPRSIQRFLELRKDPCVALGLIVIFRSISSLCRATVFGRARLLTLASLRWLWWL